jgi:type IV secretion system protein VirD4
VTRRGEQLLRYDGEGHVLTVAPTRAGKGVGCVVPNLLAYPGSVVVTDPKGENYAVTARWRRDGLSQRVFAFDPFGVVERREAAAFNPLDLVDVRRADAHDRAWMLADMLVVPDGRGGEEHFWDEEARGLLQGLILFVAAHIPERDRHLPMVRRLLTLPKAKFNGVLGRMARSDAVGGLVARAAARLQQKAARERSGVVSTAQSHTHFLDSPLIGKAMSRSDLALGALKTELVSLYLILPPDRLDSYRRWLRLMIGCAVQAMTADADKRPVERVLFLLDEFAQLGRMRPVERGVTLVGGFGATFWLLVQDLAQLRRTYPDAWETLLANADVLQVFGINDYETAEHLSKLSGEATIVVESENESKGVSRGKGSQTQRQKGRSRAERGRRLVTADEVRRLSAERVLLFVKGSGPIDARRVDYRRDAIFTRMADANPLYDVAKR